MEQPPNEEQMRQELATSLGALPLQGGIPQEYPVESETQFKVDVGEPGLKFDPESLELVAKDIPYGNFNEWDKIYIVKLGDAILRIYTYQARLRAATGDKNFNLSPAMRYYFEKYKRYINVCRGMDGWTLTTLQTQNRNINQRVDSSIGLPAPQKKKNRGVMGKLFGGT